MTERRSHISGRVIDSLSGSGIADVRVEAWSRAVGYDSILGRANTDINGSFQISCDKFNFRLSADELPALYFKVFRSGELIKSTEDSLRHGVAEAETAIIIEVNVSQPLQSSEVALHELGESVAAAVISVQQELARYPASMGVYLLDEVDLSIPVCLRIDSLGQVMATVIERQQPGEVTGQMRLHLRPVQGRLQSPHHVISDLPLADLCVLAPEVILRLEAQRIFSIDDLLRVARHASGRNALVKMGLGVELDSVLNRADVLLLPMLPIPVARSLLRIGIKAPSEFVERDAEELAEILTAQLNQVFHKQDIICWQQEVDEYIAIPLPCRQPCIKHEATCA